MNSKIISFAIEAHYNANHQYDGKPYAVHLAMVVMYAMQYAQSVNIESEELDNVISACWLHDAIEDCRLTYNDVKAIAGEVVAEIVYAVSNEKGKTRKERASATYYEGIRKIPLATYVKLCDRMANAKYARDTNSKMLTVYQKENEGFLNVLFQREEKALQYKQIIKDLKKILEI